MVLLDHTTDREDAGNTDDLLTKERTPLAELLRGECASPKLRGGRNCRVVYGQSLVGCDVPLDDVKYERCVLSRNRYEKLQRDSYAEFKDCIVCDDNICLDNVFYVDTVLRRCGFYQRLGGLWSLKGCPIQGGTLPALIGRMLLQ